MRSVSTPARSMHTVALLLSPFEGVTTSTRLLTLQTSSLVAGRAAVGSGVSLPLWVDPQSHKESAFSPFWPSSYVFVRSTSSLPLSALIPSNSRPSDHPCSSSCGMVPVQEPRARTLFDERGRVEGRGGGQRGREGGVNFPRPWCLVTLWGDTSLKSWGVRVPPYKNKYLPVEGWDDSV